MKVLVTGGRAISDEQSNSLIYVLNRLHLNFKIGLIIHGDCPHQIDNNGIRILNNNSADQIAQEWAEQNNIDYKKYTIDHEIDGPWPGAGPRRNFRMVVDSQPDVAVAAYGNRGTANCIVNLEKKSFANIIRLE